MDFDAGGGRVGEPCALFLLQRRGLRPAPDHVFLDDALRAAGRAEGQRDQDPRDGGVLRQPRGLCRARPDERHLRTGAARDG